MNKNVTFLGFVDDPKAISELYRRSALLMISRLGWHGYGISSATLQALYHGKPILTDSYNAKNFPDYPNCGGMIIEDNYKLWSSTLDEFIFNTSQYKEASIDAINYYDKYFSARVHVRLFENFLSHLAK